MFKDPRETDDLFHLLVETLVMEGYEVDSEIEREVLHLAKLAVTKSNFNEEDEDSLENEDLEELNIDLDWSEDEEI